MSIDINEAIRAEVRAQVRALLPGELERVLRQRDAEVLSYEEAAQIIGMSVSWLQKARGAKGPPRIKEGAAVRFRRSDLIAWLARCTEAKR